MSAAGPPFPSALFQIATADHRHPQEGQAVRTQSWRRRPANRAIAAHAKLAHPMAAKPGL